MKKLVFLCAALILGTIAVFAQQPQYDTYFTPERLRVDLTFAGDATYQKIFLEGLTKEALDAISGEFGLVGKEHTDLGMRLSHLETCFFDCLLF